LAGAANSYKKLKDYETAKEFYNKAIEDCTEPNTKSLLCEYLYEKADILLYTKFK
jgi:tetratricopeptide (TPR) repeat protein